MKATATNPEEAMKKTTEAQTLTSAQNETVEALVRLGDSRELAIKTALETPERTITDLEYAAYRN